MKNIKARREALGLSIRALAALVGCNKDTITRLERQEREEGEARPSPLLSRALGEALTIPHVRAKTYRARRTSRNMAVAHDLDEEPRTICGEPITDRDIDLRTARSKSFKASGWPLCDRCDEALNSKQGAKR